MAICYRKENLLSFSLSNLLSSLNNWKRVLTDVITIICGLEIEIEVLNYIYELLEDIGW